MIRYRFVLTICIAISFLVCCASGQLYTHNVWSTYHKNIEHVVISNSKDGTRIQLPTLTTNLWKTEEYFEADNKLYRKLSNKTHYLELFSHNGELSIFSNLNQTRIGLDEKLFIQNISSKYSLQMQKNAKKVQQIEKKQQKQLLYFDVTPNNLLILISENGQRMINKVGFITAIKQGFNRKVENFMNLNRIAKDHFNFSAKKVKQTLDQICVEETPFDRYYGLCYDKFDGKIGKHSWHEIDIRLSPLTIDILFIYDENLALWLFQNFISYLEQLIFYRELQFVQIPEHIEIIQTYLKVDKKQGKAGLDREIFHEKLKAVLNGLLNQMLLSDVNSLDEEINYRQNKKIHPALLKMLSLTWKARSLKNAVSSFYDESFTPDYYYHSSDEKPDLIVGKISWLIRASAEYTQIVYDIGNKDDKQALEQVIGLIKILINFVGDDANAKQGKYYSIIRSGGNRLYAIQIGYESLLPYIYEASSVFPGEMLRNITTPYGISSLNRDHLKFNDKYEFRGNIHLYFNFKILNGMTKFLKGKPMLMKDIQNLNNAVKKFILKNSKDTQGFDSFTMWSVEGKGIRNRKSISILNCVFLRDQESASQ